MSYLRNELYIPGTWNQAGSSVYYSLGNVGIGTNNPATALQVTGISSFSSVGIGVTTPQTPLDITTSSGIFLGAAGAQASFTYGDVRIISGNVGNGFTIPYFQTYAGGTTTSVGLPGYVMGIQPFIGTTVIGNWASRGTVGGFETPHQMWFPSNQNGIVAKANWLTHKPANTVTGAQAPTVPAVTDYLNYSNPVNTTYSASSIYSNFGSLALTPASTGITIIARVLFGAASSGQNSWERICDFGNGSGVDNILLGRYSTTNQIFTNIFKGTKGWGNLTGGTIVQNAVTNVAMKYSPSAGYLYLYQNGALVNSVAAAAATYAIDNTRTNCYLGRSNWAADSMFTGYIYQFQCHNATLTDQEIFTIMNSWGSTPAMTVTTEGRLGIGITNPGALTQINASVINPTIPTVHIGDNANDFTATYGMVHLVRNATPGDTKAHLTMIRNGNTGFNFGFYNNTNTFGIWRALQNTGTTPTIAIDNGSDLVGIGKTPGYTLDAAGDINLSGSYRLNGILQPKLTPTNYQTGMSSATIGPWDITNFNCVEIRINWSRNGAAFGTMTFSFKDSAGNARAVSEAYTNTVTPSGATTGSGTTATLASNSEVGGNAYGALIRVWSTNTGGTGGRYHYEFVAVGCYAGVGATRNYGAGYVTAASGTINQLVLTTSAGTFDYKSSVTTYV